jgi:hypothetical protein
MKGDVMKDVENKPLMEQEEKVDSIKDTKKLLEAFSAVFRHQHGKEPTQEEIAQFLAQKLEQPEEELSKEDDDSPSVLKYKVIYGKSNKPLFFSDGNRFFECANEAWHEEKPHVISELDERPITTGDLYYAIMHGLVNDMDYQRLAEKNLIPHESKQLYEKLQKLNETVSQLRMSQESLEKAMPEDGMAHDLAHDLAHDMAHDMAHGMPMDDFENEWDVSDMEEQGTNVVAEVLRIALERGLAPELEQAIRRIVQEELMKTQSPMSSLEPAAPLSTEDVSNLDEQM